MAERRTDWRTPKEFFQLVNKGCKFAVDAAADAENKLCERWYGPGSPDGEDALQVVQWLSPAWCNPPYLAGTARDAWLGKFIQQAEMGGVVVALLPAATGASWWANLVVPYCDILFLTPRLPFELPDREKRSQPNHDSALCFYTLKSKQQVGWIDWRKALDPREVAVEQGEAPSAEVPQ